MESIDVLFSNPFFDGEKAGSMGDANAIKC
jgi:hypothetical protein